MKEDFLFVERYRPKTIDECILPENLKNTFKTMRDSGEILNMILSGPAGTGKTTVAKALCEELGCSYIVINGSDEGRLMDTLRTKINSFASSMSTDGKTKVVILDEADYILPDPQAALRNFMETFSKNCRFILTCNFKNKIIKPLQSRCANIDFTFSKTELPALQVQMTKRVFEILVKENIEFDKAVVLEMVKLYTPDNRRILNEIQRYSKVNGKIDIGALGSQLTDSTKISALVGALKKADFKACRQFIAENPDPDMIFGSLYDGLAELVEGPSIPQLVMIMGEYSYRSSMVSNQEINLAAACVEIIKSVKWK